MRSPYGLFRLLWRPAALVTLFPLFWAVAWPVISLAEGTGVPVSALWSEPGSAPVRKALWHMVILVPIVLGGFTVFLTHEVRTSGLGWSLPGLRRSLCSGALLICLPVAAVLGWFLSRGGHGFEGVAAFAMACFWFLVPGALMAPGTRRVIDGALFGLLMVAILLPRRFGTLVAAEPVMFGLFGLVAAAALLRLQFGVAGARRQWLAVDSGAMVWNSRFVSWWLGGGKGEWTRSLASNRLLPWLHAGAYEAGDGKVSRYLRATMLGAAFVAGYVHFFGGPSTAAWWFGLLAGSRSVKVNAGLLYPLSRSRRATAAYVGALIEGGLLIGMASVLLLILGAIPFPETWILQPEKAQISWLTAYVIALSCLPLALWNSISEPPGLVLQVRFGDAARLLPMAVFMVLVILWLTMLRRWGDAVGNGELLLVAVPTAFLMYGGLWWFTRRHFARCDLRVVLQ